MSKFRWPWQRRAEHAPDLPPHGLIQGFFPAWGKPAPVDPSHLTTDPEDPRLGRGKGGTGMNEVYLVLSEEERSKGFIRPYRNVYKHVGPPGPTHELRDLTGEAIERYAQYDYVKFEPYDDPESAVTGKFWTAATLRRVDGGCGTVTTMGQALSETYAREPGFYGATYCCGCGTHLPVAEFIWTVDGERVGS